MKLNTEIKTNIHNRFRIKVIRNNEVVQEGYAENIVTDRMYTRLMSFSPFFTQIHVGGGTGTLSPSRTTLFSPITYKAAADDEKVKAYPISSVTKKIEFGTTEQNGKTFTEVGISESTTNGTVNTHALIKDAEGNPLSITKTDTDIITIYATIFFELVDDPSVDGRFNKIPTENNLINYVIDGSTFTPSLWLGDTGGYNSFNYISYFRSSHVLTRTSDSINRKNTYSTRLDVGHANYDIGEIALHNVYRVDLENSVSWNGHTLSDVNIGVGDGVTTSFNILRYGIRDFLVKIDGVETHDYTLSGISYANKPYLNSASVSPIVALAPSFYGFRELVSIGTSPSHVLNTNEAGIDLTGYVLEVDFSGSSTSYLYFYIEKSDDGINYTSLLTRTSYGVFRYTFTQNYPYVRIRASKGSFNDAYINYMRFVNPDYAEPTVTFATPPPEDAPITVSYSVPYIPKTEDYVIDLSLDLHW